MISLAGGLPDARLFPVEELAVLSSSVIRNAGPSVLQYGPTAGSLAARSALSCLFDDEIEAEDLVVTTGSQQGLDLLGRVLIDPGDIVVVSDPDYLGALQCFRGQGATLHPIPVDESGMCVDHLEDDLRWGLRPKCLYLVPHFHNPTGTSLATDRRRTLAELASRYGFTVIEDDPYRMLTYGEEPVAEHVGDPELTVRLRSTSKVLAPGLRVGALAGPAWLRDAVVTAKQSTDLHTSSLAAAIASEALVKPWFASHVAGLREFYSQKCARLSSVLRSNLGDTVEFTEPRGGMFLWLQCREVGDTTHWLEDCLRAGVCFVPGAAFSVSQSHRSYLRLSYATASEVELEEAVRRMCSVLPSAVGAGVS